MEYEPSARPSRRYSEQEVALVIKRAAELQAAAADQPSIESGGLSLDELEQVAREAGIDPSLIRQAATDLDDNVVPTRANPFLGRASSIVVERTIHGVLPIDEHESIVNDLRRTYNDNGLPSTLGRTLAWSSSPAYGRRNQMNVVNFTVSTRGGSTTIRGEESLRPLAGALFGGLMGGLGGGTAGIWIGVGSAVLHSIPAGFGLWGAAILTSYYGARTLFARASDRRGDRLREVVDRIARHIEATAVVEPSSVVGASAQGQLSSATGSASFSPPVQGSA